MAFDETFNNMNTEMSSSQYDLRRMMIELFNNQHQDATRQSLLAWLTRRSSNLKSLCRCLLQERSGGRYLGTRTVAIEQITGSEDRSRDFDTSFHPLSSRNRQRWVSVAVARKKGISLPPVELIKVGDEYFVRDGHHRLSVAHAFGEHFIDAVVTEW